MITKQRKRILNIIRCQKNLIVLKSIKLEMEKVRNIQQQLKLSREPEIITYIGGRLIVTEGFTMHQAIKIELENLTTLINQAGIGIKEYHTRLDILLNKFNTKILNK
jgi:hypothetical protein